MQMPIRKIKLWFGFTITLFILVGALTFIIEQQDDAKKDLLIYIKNNDNLRNEIGNITNINIKKATFVSSSSTEDAYRLYRIHIYGKNGNANILVKAVQLDSGDNTWEFNIQAP